MAHNNSPARPLDLLNSLPGASFDAVIRQHAATCHPNTRLDVLAQIRSWADGDSERHIYWLRGLAGTGKSTIALTVAREYSHKQQLGASFFFSRGNLGWTQRFAATIAVQLSQTAPELCKHITDAATSSNCMQGLGLYDQWEKLILRPLGQLGKWPFPHPLIIVVDALDECGSDDEFFLLIRCLAAAVAVERVNLRIFITSRVKRPIDLGFVDTRIDLLQVFNLHDIEESIVDQDLTLYYEYQLEQIAKTCHLDEAYLSASTVQILVQKSCGLFIYAATLCRFLRECGRFASDRLAHILSDVGLPPRGGTELDHMYMIVLEYSLYAHLQPDEIAGMREQFVRVVGSIALLFDPLSTASLAMILGDSKAIVGSPLDSLHSLIDIPEEADGLIQLRHLSFHELLVDPQRCSNALFFINAKEAHRRLFNFCLRVMAVHLRQDMCDLRRPGTRVRDIPRSNIDNGIPEAVQYACRYWVYHLERSDINPRKCSAVIDFFETRFLFWIETLSLIGRLADGITMVQLLETRVPRGTISRSRLLFGRLKAKLMPRRAVDLSNLGAVIYDAKRFLLSHRSIIEEAPLQIYCSALIFSPEVSIIRRLYMHQMPNWVMRAPALSEDWSEHLHSLSHPSEVAAIVFSPDGRLIASGSGDGTVRIWDTTTGVERRVLRGHSLPVDAVTFSQDGRLIASGSGDKTIRVWHTTTGAKRLILKGHLDFVHAVAFSPDGKLIASGSSDQTVRIWDMKTGTERYIHRSDLCRVYAVAFLPSGRLLASGSNNEMVHVWDTTPGGELRTLHTDSHSAHATAFSPDGRLIVSGSSNRTVNIWDAATGTRRRILQGHSAWVNAVAFSPDGRLVASGSGDKTVRIWDTSTGAQRYIFQVRSALVNAVVFSPDGQLVASGSGDGTVQVWDMTKSVRRHPRYNYSDLAYSVAFSPDNRLVVRNTGDKMVRVWDTSTQKERRILQGHSGSVHVVAFSPDSRLIAFGLVDKTIQIWDTVTVSKRHVLKGHSDSVNALAFSPDSQSIVSSSADRIVRIWDTATGVMRRIEVFAIWVDTIAFSPDSRLIALGFSNGMVRILEIATGTQKRVLHGHLDSINALAFSPNGGFIVSGSSDKTIRIWDVAIGPARHILQGHSDIVQTVAFSPDGQLIASTSRDGTVRGWDVTTGAERQLCETAIVLKHLSFSLCANHLITDRGNLRLPSATCRCPHHVFSTKSWITNNGEDIFYLHPAYQNSFGFLSSSGNIVVHIGGVALMLAGEAIPRSM